MKYSLEKLEEFVQRLKKNPSSPIFMPAAEGFRRLGDVKRAHRICFEGLKHFPDSAAGHMIMAKILADLNKVEESLDELNQVIELEVDYLSAYFLMGELYLRRRQIKNALHSYKILLLYRPKDKKVQRIIKNLESLTAKEYSEKLFKNYKYPKELLREPSHVENIIPLIDALIVRADYDEAQTLIKELKEKIGEDPRLEKRLEKINNAKDISLRLVEKSKKKIFLKKLLTKLDKKGH